MSWAEDEGLDAYDPDDIRRMRELELQFDPKELRLYWVTKSGEHIFIEDMDTAHIERIVRSSIEGKIDLDEQTEHRFEIELSIRRRLDKKWWEK